MRQLRTFSVLFILIAGLLAPLAANAQLGSNQSCCYSITQQLNSIKERIDALNTANNKGQQTQAQEDQRIADYQSKTLSELLKQKAKTDAFLDYQEPTDYECATATLAQGDVPREIGGQIAADKIEAAVARSFNVDNDIGNPIGQKRIFTAVCKLGAIGNTESDRHGTSCDTVADPELRDRDVDIQRAILSDFCIPMDGEKVAKEIETIFTTDNYSPGVSRELNKAVLAGILMRRYGRTDQERYPKKATFENSVGLMNASIMTDSLARRFSANGGVLAALIYHSCLSQNSPGAQGCDKGDQEAKQYLQKYNPNMPLPPGGYCLSQLQKDIAENIKDAEELKNYATGGSDLRSIRVTNLKQNIAQREARWKAIDAAASSSVNEKNADITSVSGPRAVKDGAFNDHNQDLVAAIRKLTKVLEERGMSIEIPQPVRDVRPVTPHPGPQSRNEQENVLRTTPAIGPVNGSSGAVSTSSTALDVLPPIQRNYPVVGQ